MGRFSVALLIPGSHLEVTEHNSKMIEPISALPQFTKKGWGWDGAKEGQREEGHMAWHLARTNSILKKQVCFARDEPGEVSERGRGAAYRCRLLSLVRPTQFPLCGAARARQKNSFVPRSALKMKASESGKTPLTSKNYLYLDTTYPK